MPGLLTLHTDLKSLKYGHDRPGGGSSSEPYYTVDINRIDGDGGNPRLGNFNKFRLSSFDGGFIRGGIIGATNASIVDTYRITRFLYSSVKGPLFIAKQVGLQLANPKLESRQVKTNRPTKGGGFLSNVGNFVTNTIGKIENALGPTRIYNLGINTLAQVPINAIGGHIVRHGFLPKQDPDKLYIKVVADNNQNGTNRLELLADDFKLGGVGNNKDRAFKATRKFQKFAASGASLLSGKGLTPGELVIDAYIGGPDSTYGLVSTLIKRYDQTRSKDQGIADKPQVQAGKSRDDNGNIVELSVKPDFLGASNNKFSRLASNGWDISINNGINNYINDKTSTDDIAGDKSGSLNTLVSQSAIDTFLGASNSKFSRLSEDGWNITTNNGLINNYLNDKTSTDDIAGDKKHSSISGSNTVDLIPNGPSSYPNSQGVIGLNLLSLPDTVYDYRAGTSASYDVINTVVGNLTSPNNLGIYTQLNHNGIKAVNGQRLPSSQYKPTYRSNNSGQTKTITLPQSWRNVTREVRVGSGISDLINLTPIFPAGVGSIKDTALINGKTINTNDLVKFRIQSINTDNPTSAKWMIFRAYLTQFSDGVDATWNATKYVGRGDKFYIYEGFDRKISIGFKVAALSAEEMRPMYQKLNYLMGNLMPDYSGGLMRGPLVRMTVGNWIDGQLGILTSISYTIPQDSPWEISLDGKEMILPHILEVSLNFTPIGSQTRDVNELSRKEECISNIAQNWNGATAGEPEYIVPCTPEETIVPPTPAPPTPTPTPVPQDNGGGGVTNTIPNDPFTYPQLTYTPERDNTRVPDQFDPTRTFSTFRGGGGGSFGGGGSNGEW